MRSVGKFNIPQMGPEPRAIGNWRIRVTEQWLDDNKPVEERLSQHEVARDREAGLRWYKVNPETTKLTGVRL